MVISAVGFRGAPLPGLPFDADNGIVPNDRGRVVADGEPVPGTFVTGWLKRGPTGIIGTNKPAGAETAAAVLEDLPGSPGRTRPDILDTLSGRGVATTDWQGWLRLDT
ncbi:hypothetical protein [Pseudonocardia sp. N23]|uniref:hypothetical protein n=1 Tax=Pseudonocardia sp. N23 TaxID=1987376 RepID=UPI00209C11E4|nr:hypothetical protein [Pseudonocardia sp. N23]